jgi:hypothetical protein
LAVLTVPLAKTTANTRRAALATAAVALGAASKQGTTSASPSAVRVPSVSVPALADRTVQRYCVKPHSSTVVVVGSGSRATAPRPGWDGSYASITNGAALPAATPAMSLRATSTWSGRHTSPAGVDGDGAGVPVGAGDVGAGVGASDGGAPALPVGVPLGVGVPVGDQVGRPAPAARLSEMTGATGKSGDV